MTGSLLFGKPNSKCALFGIVFCYSKFPLFISFLVCLFLFGHCSGAEDGLAPDQVAAISAPRLQRYFETKGSHLAERTWREWNTLANSFQPLALEFLEKVSTVIKCVSADSIATPCLSWFWFVDIQVYNTHRCIPFRRGCLQKMVYYH